MITEDYVSFETAKLLKEKGFDVETRGYYPIKGDAVGRLFANSSSEYNHNHSQVQISAPTLQMAMKWLRYHNWTISVEPKEFLYDLVAESWGYKIWADAALEVNVSETYKTYEEACEAAIKYCLENLV